MDSVACASAVTTMLLQMYSLPGSAPTFGSRLRCWLFDNQNVLFTSVFASQAGLVIITIERYLKLVHPIFHRNRFRPWMIKAGVILPWLNGILVSFIPSMAMTQIINGVCMVSLAFTLGGKIFSTARFVWQIMIPIAVFAFCYWNIVARIHQKLAISPGNGVVVKSCLPGAPAEGSAPPGWISQTQRNAVRTMITVVVCYSLCWPPPVFSSTLYLYYPTRALSSAFQPLGFFSYINMLMNPIIYSTHLGTVKRIKGALRRLLKWNDPKSRAEETHASENKASTRIGAISVVGHLSLRVA
jgi:hypothetical protein